VLDVYEMSSEEDQKLDFAATIAVLEKLAGM
jgi:hypothetical protein